MFISDFAIKRPIVTVVDNDRARACSAIFALFKTDVDEFPDIQQPIVLVAVPYPGASPGQVEREVVDRMEEQFNAISGIDQITSTSTDGFAQIIVLFVFSKDPDQAAQDIRDAISEIRDKLPTEMKEPIIKKLDPGELPIVSLALTSADDDPVGADDPRRPGDHQGAARRSPAWRRSRCRAAWIAPSRSTCGRRPASGARERGRRGERAQLAEPRGAGRQPSPAP